MNTTLQEVKERMSIFVNGHRQAQHDAADLVMAICDSINMDSAQKRRVRHAFLGRERKKIKFSDARKMLGVKDTRAWNKLCDKDPLYATIEVTGTTSAAYCWEDEINAALAMQNDLRGGGCNE